MLYQSYVQAMDSEIETLTTFKENLLMNLKKNNKSAIKKGVLFNR